MVREGREIEGELHLYSNELYACANVKLLGKLLFLSAVMKKGFLLYFMEINDALKSSTVQLAYRFITVLSAIVKL